MTNRHSVFIQTTLLCSAALFGNYASASGFAIIEQGVSGLGNAFAGGAASAEDASTIFYNPAGITRLKGSQVITAGHIIAPSSQFVNDGSQVILQDPEGNPLPFGPLTGGDGGDAGDTAFVPNLYYVMDLSGSAKFGLGINAPFGLKTEYEKDWIGRYHGVTSELKTININPTFAFELGRGWSFGFGADLQIAEGTLTSAVDFGTICLGLQDAIGIGDCNGDTIPLPQEHDGFATVDGDSFAAGYNLGFLYEHANGARFGTAYRSKVEHTIEGTADFDDVPTTTILGGDGLPLTVNLSDLGFFIDTDAQLAITLPETLSISGFQPIGSSWAVMADLTWTRWSQFSEIRVQYDEGFQGDTVTPANWDNTFRVAIGANYYPNDQWTIRAGAAFDESPIPSEELRTPRVPDNDRTWLTLGASWALSDRFKLDFGYAHLFIDDVGINVINETGALVSGYYEADVDILSGQLQILF